MIGRVPARLAVDICGTFTDVAIDVGPAFVSAKIRTTPADPVDGVVEAVDVALAKAGLVPEAIESVVHGTTLATNALIERKGAEVGLVTTEGFRDILEIGYERRYDQYDLFLDKPDAIVQRDRSYTVRERMDARGNVLVPLDEGGVATVLAALERDGVDSVAVGFLHSYANGAHEERVRELFLAQQPDLAISLSCEVSPEIREYDRLSTTVANAYVMPLMASYLRRLDDMLRERGFRCPLLVMTSGGGMTTIDTAARFPIRLVESGPSGGAVLAGKIAREAALDRVVSFDMGGTTAKVCLIEDGVPQSSREFEVARAARFTRGSGLPVRIPVLQLIEIGAGGGSVAAVDSLGRLSVGPESAGAEPGPAAYDRGGSEATVTDADTVMGFLDPESFAEGRLRLDAAKARAAVERHVAQALELDVAAAADGIAQIVDENMANAARIHAVERGVNLAGCTMVAFGGNGPLHATRVAEKVGVSRIVVPPDPGVGSAVGFLGAPVSYEIVRSRYMLMGELDFDEVNRLFVAMEEEARAVVAGGAGGEAVEIGRSAFMRYLGQGHEIEVPVQAGRIDEASVTALRARYEERYAELYARHVPYMEIEIMNWAVVAATPAPPLRPQNGANGSRRPDPSAWRTLSLGWETLEVPCFERSALAAGDTIAGPALVTEPQTTTFVGPSFDASVDAALNLVLTRS
jgi:N-methylhydantoinase A